MTVQTKQPHLTDPSRMAAAALQGFFSITGKWGLSARQQRVLLGEPPESTFFKWKSEQAARRLDTDTLERISYILGIHKALRILLPTEEAACAWVNKPNSAPPFGGQTALSRMLGGHVADLYDVRRYLDAERG